MFKQTDRLRPAALYFIKNGHYTNALPNTKDYYEYWDKERQRCVYGYTVGKGKENRTIDFIDKIRSEYAPHKVLLFKDTSINNSQLDKLASWTSTQYSIDEKPTAYICKNFACNQPTNDLKTALNLLNE